MRIGTKTVGMLLCTISLNLVLTSQAAFALVSYSGIQDIKINATNPDVEIDLDGGGSNDFLFELNTGVDYSELTVDTQFNGSNYYVCSMFGPSYGPPLALAKDAEIGPSQVIDTSDHGILAGDYDTWVGGNFIGGSGYIGVKFLAGSSWHYGWIHYSANSDASEGIISGWAYETNADQLIHAGDIGVIPAPGALLLGAIGIGCVTRLRRRRAI